MSFLIRFIFYYNVYGNLFLLGAITPWLLIILWAPLVINQIVFIVILVASIILTLICLFRAVLIISAFNEKYRYYRLAILRLQKKGYSEKYFELGLYEPCMRIITKDILRQFGFAEKYKDLVLTYGAEDPYLNNAKRRLFNSLGVTQEEISFISKGGKYGEKCESR